MWGWHTDAAWGQRQSIVHVRITSLPVNNTRHAFIPYAEEDLNKRRTMSERPENKETQHSQTVVSCRSKHCGTELDRSRHSLRCTCHVLFDNSRHFVPCRISASGDAKRCAVLCSTRAFVLLERVCIVAETEALIVTLQAVEKPI